MLQAEREPINEATLALMQEAVLDSDEEASAKLMTQLQEDNARLERDVLRPAAGDLQSPRASVLDIGVGSAECEAAASFAHAGEGESIDAATGINGKDRLKEGGSSDEEMQSVAAAAGGWSRLIRPPRKRGACLCTLQCIIHFRRY